MINAKDKEGNPISLLEGKDIELYFGTDEGYIKCEDGFLIEWTRIIIPAGQTYAVKPLPIQPILTKGYSIYGTPYYNSYAFCRYSCSISGNGARADCVGFIDASRMAETDKERNVYYLLIGKWK